MKLLSFTLKHICAFLVFVSFGYSAAAQSKINTMQTNKDLIQSYFKKWADGTGTVFEILDDNATWTISGTSPLSKTYTSKKQLIDEVINPLNTRLSQKIIPTIKNIYEDGNTVIVIWDGKAIAKDGQPYNVTYAWFMEIENGKIIKVTAFLDTIDFSEIFSRIK